MASGRLIAILGSSIYHVAAGLVGEHRECGRGGAVL
eukprot:SAG31_NODE_4098_length_3588_cov_2.607624_1_plen_35_part_10